MEVSQFVLGAERGLKMPERSNQPRYPGSKTRIFFFSSFVLDTTDGEKTDREFIPAAPRRWPGLAWPGRLP